VNPIPMVTQYLSHMVRLLMKHRHVFIVVTLLTLVMTFPTIVYVFNTDVFWHPGAAHRDTYMKFWDVWYGKLFLTGQADPFYTDLMFYPDGLSLKTSQFCIPHIIVVNALNAFMPISNAFSFAYLLIIFTSALSAYFYLVWLFKDKWIALFGAVLFGFSPHVIIHSYNPDIAFLATIPLILYCIHRGAEENRRVLVLLAGLLTGLTTVISLYQYICVLILLGFFLCALAISRWRDKSFWLNVLLLVLSIGVSSLWRIYPLISDAESMDKALAWYPTEEIGNDAVSLLVNYRNPFLGNLVQSIFPINHGRHSGDRSPLGYLPLVLIGVGFFTKATRRKMLPWAFSCAFFLIMRLGSHLNINGTAYPDIRLPKYYLDQVFPAAFEPFYFVQHFTIGVLLPFTVLACFGLAVLQKRLSIASKPTFVLALVLIIAFEYYVPVRSRIIPDRQIEYLDWLKQEDDAEEIRLINLPMGRSNAKRHSLHQALSGFPQVEGATSRTPERAYDYIRANYLLNNWAWENQRPVHCDMPDREAYMAGLAQLEKDGFSHVVYHQHEGYYFWADIKESFHGIEPSYSNGAVSVFRLSDLRDSCSSERSANHLFTRAYADAIQLPPPLDERYGALVVLPPTPEAGDHFMRYLRHFSEVDRTIVTITWDEQTIIDIHDSEFADPNADINPEQFAALWLVNVPLTSNYQQTEAYQQWFTKRFTFCQRFHEEERATIDLYLRAGIPCAAMDESSAIDVRYDSGLRLHNALSEVSAETIRFFLAWTNNTENSYGFSLQFFDDAGGKALQYDNVIYPQLLTAHEIDTTALSAGVYRAKLIVYDFETRKSQGGMRTDTGERFERELEIASIEINR